MFDREKDIQKTIYEIENNYPEDNLIVDYKSFLKYRDYLHLFQFNENVFLNLIDLTLAVWDSEKRINRFSLYSTIKRYGYITDSQSKFRYPQFKLENPNLIIRKRLFTLFKNAFSPQTRISDKQIVEIQKIANSLIINLAFEQEEEEWFVSNSSRSDTIINRILRYPQRSNCITKWVKKNFQKDYLRTRRPELISWLLDVNPDYSFDKETLLFDFEYLNALDEKAIQKYEEEMEAVLAVERDFDGILPKKKNYFHDSYYDSETIIPFPKLKLQQRHYSTIVDTSKSSPDISVHFPDLTMMRERFRKELDVHYSQTMMWAVAYSRLSTNKKISLLKKYFIPKNYYTLLNICKKYKLKEPLLWLLSITEK